MANKVAESLGSSLIFWWIVLRSRRRCGLKLTTVCVGFACRCQRPFSYRSIVTPRQSGSPAGRIVLPSSSVNSTVITTVSFSRISPS